MTTPRQKGAAAIDTGQLVARVHATAIAHIAARRGQDEACHRQVHEGFGLALPEDPQLVSHGELSVLGIGPGRWLAMMAGAGPEFAVRVGQMLAGCAAVNDLSDAYVVWHFQGPGQRDMLARLVPIDVHERAFAIGRTAQSVASHVGVLLWRLDDRLASPAFALAVARSYSADFRTVLEEAAGARVLRFDPA